MILFSPEAEETEAEVKQLPQGHYSLVINEPLRAPDFEEMFAAWTHRELTLRVGSGRSSHAQHKIKVSGDL